MASQPRSFPSDDPVPAPSRARTVLTLLSIALVAFVATLIDAAVRGTGEDKKTSIGAAVVSDLGLTDLAIFTEARFTRNPSLADLHSPLQDHPLSLDHFPSGSLIPGSQPWGRATLTAKEPSP